MLALLYSPWFSACRSPKGYKRFFDIYYFFIFFFSFSPLVFRLRLSCHYFFCFLLHIPLLSGLVVFVSATRGIGCNGWMLERIYEDRVE
jgi:hypothetical protein